MKTYNILFRDGDSEQVRSFKATSPGHAFAKCLRKYPNAKPIQCRHEGGLGAEYGCINYQPPSTARVVAEPESKAEETRFPFFDDCQGRPMT